MKVLKLLILTGFLVTFASGDVTKGNFGAAKQEDEAPKPEKKAEPKEKRATYPFYGTLDSVNAAEMTLTLKGKKKNRVILVTSDTRIQKGNSSAKIHEGVPGERVSGSVRKNADGREEALTVRFGSKPSGK